MLNSTLDKVIRTTKAHLSELSFMGINTLEDLFLISMEIFRRWRICYCGLLKYL